MEIQELMRYLPHRYPMLLVDRLLELVPGKSAVGLKNVTINEAFFQGHYPSRPIMPGVLILEAMAQAGAMAVLSMNECKGLIPVIGAIDNAKFKRPVVPGDQLISTCELLWLKRNVGKMKAVATVNGEVAAMTEMTFMLTYEDK